MKRILQFLIVVLQSLIIALWSVALFLYAKIKAWSLKNPTQAKTYAFVIALHLTILITIAARLEPTTVIRPRGKVVVSTIQLKKTKTQTVAAAKPKPQAPKPKPTAQKKKVETVDKEKEKLLKKALASLEKIDDPVEQADIPKPLAMPSMISGLQTEAALDQTTEDLSPQELGYCEELVAQLRLKMRLPDFGEVRVELTVDREGNITQVKVQSSQSEANRAYVEAIMPQLTLPPFGKNFRGKKKHRFLLALANDV